MFSVARLRPVARITRTRTMTHSTDSLSQYHWSEERGMTTALPTPAERREVVARLRQARIAEQQALRARLLSKCADQLRTDPAEKVVFAVKPELKAELEDVRRTLISTGYSVSPVQENIVVTTLHQFNWRRQTEKLFIEIQ